MPYIKGQSGNPAGRPVGSKNRATNAMREAMASLIDNNIDKMSGWLDQIGRDDPYAAFQCMLRLMEFHIPKMSRVMYVQDQEAENTEKDNAYKDNIVDAITMAYDKAMAEAIAKGNTDIRDIHRYIDKKFEENPI